MRVQTLALFLLLACNGPVVGDTYASRDSAGESSGGETDETDPPVDADGDGFPEDEDCDDTDDRLYPGAEEVPYDDIDQDCDGEDLVDLDGDGFVGEAVGGDDCDDEDGSVNPAMEEVENGIDDNCDGEIDEGFEAPYDDWPVLFSGSNGEVYLTQLAKSSDGTILALGQFDGKPDFDPDPENREEVSAEGYTEDVFIVELDENRNMQWLAGLTSESTVLAHEMVLDSDDQVLVVGSYDLVLDFDIDKPTYVTHSVGGTDGFLGLYASDGSLSWGASVGGGGDDACYAVVPVTGSHIWIGGSFSDNHDFDPGPGKKDVRDSPGGELGGYVLRLDYDGNYEAHYTFTGDSKTENTADVRELVPTDEGLIVVGMFSGTIDVDPSEEGITELNSDGEPGIFILELDSAGGLVWAVSIDGDNIMPRGLTRLDNGDLYLAGYYSGAIDLDPGEGTEVVSSVGESDGFILVLDNQGELLWSTRIAGAGAMQIHDMEANSAGQLFLAGSFEGTFALGETELGSEGAVDCMVARIDEAGSGWAYSLGSAEDEKCTALLLDEDEGRLYVGGWMGADMDFNPAGWDFDQIMKGTADGWLLYTSTEGP
jgi:hypothetical protein